MNGPEFNNNDACANAMCSGKDRVITLREAAEMPCVSFLRILDARYPEGDRIRLVLDSLRVHTSKETRAYLATVPGRFEFVFAPKHGSWLNMIEGFFSKMTMQMLRGIWVGSKRELEERIYLYFDEVNAEPVVHRWRYRLDDVDVSEEVAVDTLLPGA